MASMMNRRGFLSAGTGLLAAAGAMACSPAAAPPATGGNEARPPAPAARAAWEDEWDKLVAAAKQEGKLNLLGLSGPGYQKGVDAFMAAFPGVTVDMQQFTSATLYMPKVIDERKAGIYSFDVALTAVQSMLLTLRPTGAFDSIREVIFRPDVKDDTLWRNGFEAGFPDTDKKVAYVMSGELIPRFIIDTNQVKDGEIKSARDLLNPKWQGKIIMADVRTGGSNPMLASLRDNFGDDFVRKLLVDQQPTFTRDDRAIVEGVARGRYAWGLGAIENFLKSFRQEGIGANARGLNLDDAGSVSTAGALFLINRAPHPNAAKLFINWILTKEGQTIWCNANSWNTRRLDVPPSNPEIVPQPGVKYFLAANEAAIARQDDTRNFSVSLIQ
ncbi:MAG: ABC transporter substrate-binding protein [Dehalococcoidia bacterium]|nr:ABC transporter substrate-binding protein [Dehalococcoidia bacterium]